MKEDFVASLRGALQQLKENGKVARGSGVYVYEQTKFQNPHLDLSVCAMCIDLVLNSSYSKLDWNHSRRMMHGSLLVMVPHQNLHTKVLLTIMNKEVGPRKRVIITAQLHGNWNSTAQLLGQFDQWIVVESNIFFEAYRHVLGCLQKFFDDSFPLKEHLIRLEKPIAPGTLLSEPFNLLNTKGASRPYIVGENLPFEPTDMNLNESQAAAFQLALSNNVALIQGPTPINHHF
eukprot:Gregarina_sp_Poly_1__10559@NODE_781_length_6314_cov_28_558028_g573_i0_p3_GENE_NODE_781_length_6314_cov_28_558028_g573_i0NODE_781_length_6314_cov_28_558028_g573_i0_p3_ORF_typecomplete_len232_score29_63AAA_11/PF13086_6/1_5e03AAA_11/PF13086_6/0_062_NODE_781_length_6314_cov_28_558028_g573_i013622057